MLGDGTDRRPPRPLRTGRAVAAAADAAEVLVIAIAVALRFVFLTRPSASLDELSDHRVVELPLRSAVRAADGFPAVHAALLHGWNLLVSGVDAQRCVSAVAGTAAVLLVIAAAKRSIGRGGALIAGFVVASSPLLVQASREARPYGLATLFAAAALWSAVLFADRPTVLRGLLLGVSAGALVGTLYSAAPFAGLVCLLAWLRRRSQAALVSIAAGLTVLAIPTVGWLAEDLSFQQGLTVQSTPRGLLATAAFFVFALLGGAAIAGPLDELRLRASDSLVTDLAPWAVVLAVAYLVLAAAFLRSQRRHRTDTPVVGLCLLVVLPLFAAVARSACAGVDLRPRHDAVIILPLAIAAGAAAWPRNPSASARRWRWAACGAVAVVVSVQLVGSAHLAVDRRYQGVDFETSAHYLAQRKLPVVVVAGYATAGFTAVDHTTVYLPGPSSSIDRGRFARLIGDVPSSGRVCSLVVFTTTHNVDSDGALRKHLISRDAIAPAPVYRSTGVDVYESPRCLDRRVAIVGPAPTEPLPPG